MTTVFSASVTRTTVALGKANSLGVFSVFLSDFSRVKWLILLLRMRLPDVSLTDPLTSPAGLRAAGPGSRAQAGAALRAGGPWPGAETEPRCREPLSPRHHLRRCHHPPPHRRHPRTVIIRGQISLGSVQTWCQVCVIPRPLSWQSSGIWRMEGWLGVGPGEW